MIPPRVLTIAGSDSGGGAGIQADLKTLTSLHVYGSSVLTSITSQNTLGVDGIHNLPKEFVAKQLHAVLSDIGTDAIKTGMLASAEIIETVADVISQYPDYSQSIVVDPVMISTSGSELLNPLAVTTLIEKLLPLTFILTPNVPEAEYLLGQGRGSIKDLNDVYQAAKELASFGPRFVLLKGGHLPQSRDGQKWMVDVLYDKVADCHLEIVNQFIDTKNTHGTGCTLSAAIAAGLAKKMDAKEAVQTAVSYVAAALDNSIGAIGSGPGPLNHFHNVVAKPYAGVVKALIGSLPANVWSDFIDHRFVRGIADGTLKRESFEHFIKQDYLYLQNYARAAALAAYKTKGIDMTAHYAKIILHIHHEMQLHLDYCATWGITKQQILDTPESVYNVAYTRFVLDQGATGDAMDLQAAMAPCSLGYGEIGRKLYDDPNTKRG
ncbi:trifunctional hydroxymethylpyrimidine kinase/phosphomethylpyrimidine kinase/thiaminase [Umbelopsis nana]